MPIDLICLDADDTLWHNMRFFDRAEQVIVDMLAPFADAGMARAAMARIEQGNLSRYGYGAKSFTLSMIEVALELGGDGLPAATIRDILAAGNELLAHPVELLDAIEDTLAALAERGALVLVTKGDLFHQEAKLAASGLGERFAAIEIVSDKSRDVRAAVRTACDRSGAGSDGGRFDALGHHSRTRCRRVGSLHPPAAGVEPRVRGSASGCDAFLPA